MLGSRITGTLMLALCLAGLDPVLCVDEGRFLKTGEDCSKKEDAFVDEVFVGFLYSGAAQTEEGSCSVDCGLFQEMVDTLNKNVSSICLTSIDLTVEFEALKDSLQDFGVVCDLDDISRICGPPSFNLAVHGGYSGWSDWSACIGSCEDRQTEERSRTCSNPAPSNGGRTCAEQEGLLGPAAETRPCQQPCGNAGPGPDGSDDDLTTTPQSSQSGAANGLGSVFLLATTALISLSWA